MRTTKRIQAGPAPSMPGHLRFAEQITRKYGFASRNYLGPQPLTLLEPGEGGAPVQHFSLVQLTLHLRLQLQLLKQEERDMLRTYRKTLHLLEKLARRHDATERKTSSFLPAGVGTASRIAATNSATGTMRADHGQESKALRSKVGEMEREHVSSSATLGAHRHAPTNGGSAGSRKSADAGIVQSVSAGPMVHSSGRVRRRGTREALALRRDYRFADRSGSRNNVSGEQVRHVPAEQVRQARRKPESKTMAALRIRDAAAEIRERRDERKRGLQQGPSPGEGRRGLLLERDWRKPEQEQGQAFGQVLEWKRVSLRHQAYNSIHIHRSTVFFSVTSNDISAQTISENRGVSARVRSEIASSPVASDDRKGYRTVGENRGGRTVVRPIIAAASLIDAYDKRYRTLGGNGGRSTGWKKRGMAPVAEWPWLRPKGMSSLGMEILLQRHIGLFEASSLSSHRTPDARHEMGRIKGSRQTDAAAAALEGRPLVFGSLSKAGPAKFSATSSMRDSISGRYETVIFSTALIRSVPRSMLMNRYWPSNLSTTNIFERMHRQKANADLIYGRAPSLAQRKAGDEASVAPRFRYPMSVSLRGDNAFISRSPERSSNKFGASGSVQMLVGVMPSTGISAFEYDSSASSNGSVPLRSRMLLSSERLYDSRIAEAESGEVTAGSAVSVRHERTGLVTVQSKRAAAKTGNPMTSVFGVNIVSPIVSAIRSSAVEGMQLRHHPLPFGGRAVSIGPQIYAADSIGAVKQRYARRHQASQSNSAPTRGKNARHDVNDAVQGFAGKAVRSFTGGTVSGSTNPIIRRFINGAGSGLANIVLRSTPDEIRESEGWSWNLTDVRRHPVVLTQYKQSRFLSPHYFMLHKPVSLRDGGFSAFPNVTDFAGKIAGSRIAFRDGAAEERVMRRQPAGPDATLYKRNSVVYPSASEGSMAPSVLVAQFRAVPSQRARAGQATVFGPPFVQALSGTSTRMAAIITNKLPQNRADWSSAATASVLGVLSPRAPQRPLELYQSRAVADRSISMPMSVSGVLSPGAPYRQLQLPPSQADAQRSPAMAESVLGVLPPRALQRPSELYQSQAVADRPISMLASVSGVLSPGAPYRPLQLHLSRADAQRSPAMAASTLSVLPPRALQRPLELVQSQAIMDRPFAMPVSASGVLSPGAPYRPLQLHLSRADVHRSSAIHASASGALPSYASNHPLQLNRSQAVASRTSSVFRSAMGALLPAAPYRPLQLNPSQADIHRLPVMLASVSGVLPSPELHPSRTDGQRPSTIPANASGVLSPGSPHRPLQLHPSQTGAYRLPAMPTSTSGVLPPQGASLPLQLHRPQGDAQRSSVVPASVSAEGALTPRVAPQTRTARAAATPSPSYRAASSEIEYHKKQKPDTGTLAKQAAAQAVSQVSAQLEAMKIELSGASQAALPDLDRFVDQVYRELENKIKFERQRSGL
ncbi:hypothetical protein [Paenibacillus tyrfis]|uniref:Uncharacterized protein n=1 Tax=Paenibacillus tyrfis TaxID=1501230 RepID=A0A081P6T3_9BACL|nr:hypothetical protein [Paenibacillus tyrfis]KEQ26406.1 hypothetical protein ET33_31605 [Paenibacillus tyrfis]